MPLDVDATGQGWLVQEEVLVGYSRISFPRGRLFSGITLSWALDAEGVQDGHRSWLFLLC